MIVLFWQDTEIYLRVFTEICSAQVAYKYHHENKSGQVRLSSSFVIALCMAHTENEVSNSENLKTDSIRCTIFLLLLFWPCSVFGVQMAPNLLCCYFFGSYYEIT